MAYSISQNELGIKSYGTVTFPRNYDNTAQFIRVSPDASAVQIKDLFIGRNHDRCPSLVLSIQGSAKDNGMRSRLFLIFREGLLKIAKTTDVWIVTAGLNSRVTRLVGEIARTSPDLSRPIHLLGIAPWGCVSNVEQLDVQGTNVTYLLSRKDDKHVTPLEPNHAYFVLTDDGTQGQHQGALQFRAAFERTIVNGTSSVSTTADVNPTMHCARMPFIILVIEGCADAIVKVHASVVKDRTPVVFVEGTGGCCDLFAKCYRSYNGYKSQVKSDESAAYIKDKIRQTLQIDDHELAETSSINALDEEIDYFELIYECVETRSMYLNFIDFKVHGLTGDDVNSTILQALLKVTSEDGRRKVTVEEKREHLNLAYEWNQIDIVTRLILKSERDWKRVELNDLFERALRENQANFVQLFLDHDFPLNDLFENRHKIIDLYEGEGYAREVHGPLKAVYAETNQSLIWNFFQVDALFDADDLPTTSSNHRRISEVSSLMRRNDGQQSSSSSSMRSEADISQELFLWSILTGKRELALLFWTRGRNKICAAFVAMLVCKNKVRKEKNNIYQDWADEWEQLALEILEKFHSINPWECKQAIIRAVPEFGNVSWLQLAVMARSKSFIAKPVVQDVLQNIWYGHIDSKVGKWSIVFATFTVWYSLFLPYSDENKSNQYLAKRSSLNEEPDTEVKKGWWRSIWQYTRKLSRFLHAPLVNYLYNAYSRVMFLMLFSYVILCDFTPLYRFQSGQCFSSKEGHNSTKTNMTRNGSSQPRHGPSTTELILVLWVFTLFCEALRQVKETRIESTYRKVEVYLSIFWNRLDALAIVLFFGACLLQSLPVVGCFCFARILLAVDLSIWYIRTLSVLTAVKRLGPKLVMIGTMMHDLSFFMSILGVFILAFGVPTYSLLHDVESFSWHMPRQIINLAYWEIFGELDTVNEIRENYELSGYVTFFLLIAYTTIASVLLVNLLIAMFSNTFDRLHLDTDSIWKFQRYSLVCHHLTRPLLPPPFIIVAHLWRLLVFIYSRFFRTEWFYVLYENRVKIKISVDRKLARQIEEIEDALGNEVYLFSLDSDQKENDRQNDSNDEQIYPCQKIVLTKINTLENQMQAMQNQQSNRFENLQCLINGLQKIGDKDLQIPKGHL